MNWPIGILAMIAVPGSENWLLTDLGQS